MGLFLQLVVDGLALGSIYAALALALVLVNRATGMINFSQGAMAVLSTYFAYSLVQAGLPLWGAILGAVVVSFGFGAVTERVIMRRFERADHSTAIVATVGLMMLFTGIGSSLWGLNPIAFPSLMPVTTLHVGGAVMAVRAVGTIIAVIGVVVLVQLLFRGTKLGLALRAVADNPESSALSGLRVGRLLMVGWGLAAAVGAAAGILVAPTLYLTPGMLDTVLVYSLAAAILGGINSPAGAVLGAWIIGVSANLAGAYIGFIGEDLKVVVPLALMVVVLLVRPQGIFGKRELVRL